MLLLLLLLRLLLLLCSALRQLAGRALHGLGLLTHQALLRGKEASWQLRGLLLRLAMHWHPRLPALHHHLLLNWALDLIWVLDLILLLLLH